MRKFLSALTAAVVMALGFAAPAAASEPVVTTEGPCVTESFTETVGLPSARNPRLAATQTTTVTVTNVESTPEKLEVHYVVTITTHDPYVHVRGEGRGLTTVEQFGAVCVEVFETGDDGGSADDPVSEVRKARAKMLAEFYEYLSERLGRKIRP